MNFVTYLLLALGAKSDKAQATDEILIDKNDAFQAKHMDPASQYALATFQVLSDAFSFEKEEDTDL